MFITDIDWAELILAASIALLCYIGFETLAHRMRAVEDRLKEVEGRVEATEDYIVARRAERRAILENAVSHPTFNHTWF